VLISPDDSGDLIHSARDRPERDADLSIPYQTAIPNRHRKPPRLLVLRRFGRRHKVDAVHSDRAQFAIGVCRSHGSSRASIRAADFPKDRRQIEWLSLKRMSIREDPEVGPEHIHCDSNIVERESDDCLKDGSDNLQNTG
jgi:hypothetical protein